MKNMRLINADAFKRQIAGQAITGNIPAEKANMLCKLIDMQVEIKPMSGMTCNVSGCKWNDGSGNCNSEGIYISDADTGEPMCMSAVFPED